MAFLSPRYTGHSTEEALDAESAKAINKESVRARTASIQPSVCREWKTAQEKEISRSKHLLLFRSCSGCRRPLGRFYPCSLCVCRADNRRLTGTTVSRQ